MYNLHLIIISDRITAGEKSDKTSEGVIKWCAENNYNFVFEGFVSDDLQQIQKLLKKILHEGHAHLIITSGGTGFTPSDVTPEATRPLLEKLTPGIDEYLRAEGVQITPYAILSRGVSGVTGRTLIINLPGNPAAVLSSLAQLRPILPHALQSLNDTIKDEDHNFPVIDK